MAHTSLISHLVEHLLEILSLRRAEGRDKAPDNCDQRVYLETDDFPKQKVISFTKHIINDCAVEM